MVLEQSLFVVVCIVVVGTAGVVLVGVDVAVADDDDVVAWGRYVVCIGTAVVIDGDIDGDCDANVAEEVVDCTVGDVVWIVDVVVGWKVIAGLAVLVVWVACFGWVADVDDLAFEAKQMIRRE